MKNNKSEMDYIYDELDMMSEEELNKEMEMILAEVAEDESVADAEPPKELYEAVSKEIQELENARARERLSDEDKELLQYGKLYKKQLKSRKYFVLAAVLILTLACGMTSMGGPRKMFEKISFALFGREQILVNSQDEDIKPLYDVNEEKAYDEIEQKFGFYPIRFAYLPEGTIFEEALVGNSLQGVHVIYTKNEKLSVDMLLYPGYRMGSAGIDAEDKKIQEYTIEQEEIKILVKQRLVQGTQEKRWEASFVYMETSYFITGCDMEQNEFEKILENLTF